MTTDGNDLKQDTPLMETIKDPKSGQMIEVSPEVKALINSMVSIARKDATTKVDAKYKPIQDTLSNVQSENTDIMAELEKLKDSGLDESQKLQKTYDRNIKELTEKFEAETKAKLSYKGKYENTKIMTDVYSAFGDYKLSNPEHAAILFMNSVETSLEEKIDAQGNGTGEHQTMMKMIISDGNGGYKESEGRPKELFKQWIEQDSNKHLLANNLTPGAGSSHGGTVEGGTERDKLKAAHAEAQKAGKWQEALTIKTQLQNLPVD